VAAVLAGVCGAQTCRSRASASGAAIGQAAAARTGHYALVSVTPEEMAAARILLAQWDPLAVQDIDVQPQAEYLPEAARIVSILRRGIDRSDLIDVLNAQRRELSALADASSDGATADALLDWWTSVEGT
jgi:hypothetical protein